MVDPFANSKDFEDFVKHSDLYLKSVSRKQKEESEKVIVFRVKDRQSLK
jgi:hypothetical protein